jgi:predicted alpha/beta hydrolase
MNGGITVTAADGTAVPLVWRPAASPRVSALVLPALGTPAAFYGPFAHALTRWGCNVAVMELRGNGASALRPSRARDWGYGALMSDTAAAARWLRCRVPALPVAAVGHSLGGHLAILAAALDPSLVDDIVVLACASPFYDNYAGNRYWQLYLGARLIPLLGWMFGVFPGDRLGFGGRAARGVMRDWLSLALHNRFRVAGVDADLEDALAGYDGRVLSIRFDRDDLAPARAVAAINNRLGRARITERCLTASDLGCRAGHFDWCRQPETTAEAVGRWLGGNASTI